MARTPDQLIKRHLHRQTERRAASFVIVLALALLLLAEAFSPLPAVNILAQISDTDTHVGVSANPVNSLHAEFVELGETLTEREAELIEREIAAGIAERQKEQTLLVSLLLGLLALIVVNSLFDILEVKELRELEKRIRASVAPQN